MLLHSFESVCQAEARVSCTFGRVREGTVLRVPHGQETATEGLEWTLNSELTADRAQDLHFSLALALGTEGPFGLKGISH